MSNLNKTARKKNDPSVLLQNLLNLHKLWYMFDCLNQNRYLNLQPERSCHPHWGLQIQMKSKQWIQRISCYLNSGWATKRIKVKSAVSKCAGESASDGKTRFGELLKIPSEPAWDLTMFHAFITTRPTENKMWTCVLVRACVCMCMCACWQITEENTIMPWHCDRQQS